MEKVTISDFAEIMGLSRGSIYDMINVGRITDEAIYLHPATGKRMLYLEQAVQDIAENSDPDKIRRTKYGINANIILPNEKTGTAAAKGGKYSSSEGMDGDTEGAVDYGKDPEDFVQAKEHQAIARARKEKLITQKLEGTLVNREEMDRELFQLGAAMRQDGTGLPDKWTPQVVALAKSKNPQFEVGEYLRNEWAAFLERHSIFQ